MIIFSQAHAQFSLDDSSLILSCENQLLLWAGVFGSLVLKGLQRVGLSSQLIQVFWVLFLSELLWKNSFLVVCISHLGCHHKILTDSRTLFSHCSRSSTSKSRCWQACFLLRALSLACRWLSSCWVLIWCFLCVHMHPCCLSPYMDTRHTGLGLYSFNLI